MKAYLVINTKKRDAVTVAKAAAETLVACGAQVLCDAEAAVLLDALPVTPLQEAAAYEACDVVLCVGGDGTMLHAARHTMEHDKPLLGVNTGRLGFLTLVERDELHKLCRLPAGEYAVDRRSVLQAVVTGKNGKKSSHLALNDAVLFKNQPEKTISLNIYCDDILVSRFRGDGMIFATATGSTAYSMSAGGPILDSRLDGVVVTQICAHIVHTPPMVFAFNRVLHAVPTYLPEEKICLSCDGQKSIVLAKDETVIIQKSARTVPLIRFSDADQLESIDKKLKGR